MRQALFSGIALVVCTAAQAQWTMQNSHTTADLRGIHSVGGGVAWASGTNGTVLRTEDGGYLWQVCAIPPGAEHLDFRGIQAFDANTAIVMSSGKGDLSRLYKTTDGCHSWKLIFTNPDIDGFWDAISAKEQKVVILGDPTAGEFVLEMSSDGGATWKREKLPPSQDGEGAFAASNTSLAYEWEDGVALFGTGGPNGARLFVGCVPCTSKQPAKSWTVRPVDFFGAGAASGIFSLGGYHTKSGSLFLAVGGDYSKPDQQGAAAVTRNLMTWQPAQTPPHGYRSAVAYDAQTKTWITVGPNGTDISTDDGRNWHAIHPDPTLRQPPDADKNWNALSLPFVVGPHGRVGKLHEQARGRQAERH